MATRTFHGIVTTPAGTPLGGWVDVEVSDNGDYHVKFHMHSSSLLGNFDFNLRAYLTAPGFPMMAFIKSGHVSGVDSWDHEERGHSPLLALYWSKLQADATYSVAKEYKWGGVVGTIAELVNDIIDVTAGAVGAALGVVIGATREAIDWLGATLGPGGTLGVVGGVVVFAVATVAGAGVGTALILGVVAGVAIGAVTNALIKFRPLNVAEIAFARQVFGNSLPYQDVIITNLAGLGGPGFHRTRGGWQDLPQPRARLRQPARHGRKCVSEAGATPDSRTHPCLADRTRRVPAGFDVQRHGEPGEFHPGRQRV